MLYAAAANFLAFTLSKMMASEYIPILKLVFLLLFLASDLTLLTGFIYNDFRNPNLLSRDGSAEITTNGLLQLTNLTRDQQGHAFYPHPFKFKTSSNGTCHSFSTYFVFAIYPQYPGSGGHGFTFLLAPSKELPGALSGHSLGLFNSTSNGDSSNHVVAVELDTIANPEYSDIDDNHVGIDINSLTSITSAPAKYYDDHDIGRSKNLNLMSGRRMQIWIEYNGPAKQFHVTVAPIHIPKPKIPLLSLPYDLSSVVLESMYVGFSAATGAVCASHYILGWSFQMSTEQTLPLDLRRLPKLPPRGPKKVSKSVIALSTSVAVFVLASISCTILYIRRKKKYAELFEDWELSYKAQRFSYKDLYVATKGFREKELLGIGGFGRVYRGILPTCNIEVAVKRVSHDSRQGIREFIAEIVSIGELRHRNLVQLLGYCRRKGELLLVYDYMANGSLDKFLFDPLMSSKLNWHQRFRIIKGVASGLVYLHEEWEQVVIHRDIKASNVLLDGDLNGRLGDFGLARLYDHGTNPQTTHVVGTVGYLAPEISRTGKATTSTDVFGFGAFLLEVACGRRPVEPLAMDDNLVLVDWVSSCWSRGAILETVDLNLGSEFIKEEMELVLKLGLLCSHTIPTARPSMRQVLQFLDKDLPLPELFSSGFGSNNTSIFGHGEGFDDFSVFYSSSVNVSAAESIISSGR